VQSTAYHAVSVKALLLANKQNETKQFFLAFTEKKNNPKNFYRYTAEGVTVRH